MGHKQQGVLYFVEWFLHRVLLAIASNRGSVQKCGDYQNHAKYVIGSDTKRVVGSLYIFDYCLHGD